MLRGASTPRRTGAASGFPGNCQFPSHSTRQVPCRRRPRVHRRPALPDYGRRQRRLQNPLCSRHPDPPRRPRSRHVPRKLSPVSDVCLCMCVCACMCVHTCVYVCVHMHMCACVCMHVSIHVRVCTCVHACMSIHVCVCAPACMCVCRCVCNRSDAHSPSRVRVCTSRCRGKRKALLDVASRLTCFLLQHLL